MAVTTIPWGDGSGDNIYLTYPSASGDQTVQVSSDANAGSTDRTKTITFTASHHGTTDAKTLTVVQEGVPEQYIVFKDPAVGAICAAQWGDGVGIKPSQAAAVPFSTNVQKNAFWNAFSSIKTTITSFDELVYFTNVNRVNAGAFKDNTVLTSIDLSNIQQIYYEAFRGCTALAMELDIPKLSYWDYNTFYGSGVTKVKSLGNITTMGSYGQFQNCASLVSAIVPATVTTMNRYQFYGCTNLQYVIMLPTTPPTVTNTNFRNTGSCVVYVPYSADHSILSAYQTTWGANSGANTYDVPRLAELNPDGTIPT